MQVDTRLRRGYVTAAMGIVVGIGFWLGSRGVILPRLLADTGFSPTTGATIFAGLALGALPGSLFYAPLSRRFGLRRLVGTGFLLWAIAALLFAATRSPVTLVLASMLIGFGFSLMELTSGLSISLLYGARQAGMLNLLQGFWGLGALSGSFVAALLIGYVGTWRVVLVAVGLILIPFWLRYITLPPLPLPQPRRGQGSGRSLLLDPLVWLGAGVLASGIAAEAGVSLWLPTYLQQVKGLSEANSALTLTLFYVGFTVTRLASPLLVSRAGPIRSVNGLALAGSAGLVALLWLPGGWFGLALVAGTGIAIAFGTSVGLVANRHPDQVNQVYAIMYTGMGIAGISSGPLMGWLAERVGLQMAMWVPLGGYLLIILLISLYGWLEKRSPLPPEA